MKRKTLLGLYLTRKGNTGLEVVDVGEGRVQITGHWVHRKFTLSREEAVVFVANVVKGIDNVRTKVAFHG